jgi:hypothetical protein
MLKIILIIQIMINALGLFVPETSFDAVWYHLPEAQIYANTGRITKIPELYYSTMPRLGEVIFAGGFWFNNPKIIIFVIYLLFLGIVYQLGKLYLTQNQSLLFTIIVNSFYVITWQSTAGYVDILRSLFELSALYCLIIAHRRWSQAVTPPMWSYIQAGILMGFALSVKMQSLIALIASLALIPKNHKSYLVYLISAFVISFPWYYDNYLQSGHPLYPLNNQSIQQNLASHSATTGPITWIISQTTKVPLIPFRLSLAPESQLTPLLLILLPLLGFSYKFLFINHKSLILFTSTFMLLWWYLPPPETRYALTGITSLLLLELIVLFKTRPSLQTSVLWFIALAVCINFTIRLAVTYKNLPVIIGIQSKEAYITSQTTDFNREKMERYYSGYRLKLVNSDKVQ